jgi:hypothetical protein
VSARARDLPAPPAQDRATAFTFQRLPRLTIAPATTHLPVDADARHPLVADAISRIQALEMTKAIGSASSLRAGAGLGSGKHESFVDLRVIQRSAHRYGHVDDAICDALVQRSHGGDDDDGGVIHLEDQLLLLIEPEDLIIA